VLCAVDQSLPAVGVVTNRRVIKLVGDNTE